MQAVLDKKQVKKKKRIKVKGVKIYRWQDNPKILKYQSIN